MWRLELVRPDGSVVPGPEVQTRDAVVAARGNRAGLEVLESPTFGLYLTAYGRLNARIRKLEGSNLMGPAERLTPEAFDEIQLDIHAWLGLVNVLIDGERSRWPRRTKKGRDYLQRFNQVVGEQRTGNDAFATLLELRNYAQHHAHIPISIRQGVPEGVPVIAAQVELVLPAETSFEWSPVSSDYLHSGPREVRDLLMDAHRSLDLIDTTNRELLLEVFASHLEGIEHALSLAPTGGSGVVHLVCDNPDTSYPRTRLLSRRDVDLLTSLAALPEWHVILFPRRGGPGNWIQGGSPQTQRPLLQEAPHSLGEGEHAWWALDIQRARREL